MGNQHSDEKGGEDEHSQLMENYNIIKQVQDDRYGEGVLMQNKINATQCILKEYNSTDEQEFEKTYAKYKKKQDFNHENIVMMIGLAKKKESQLCSTFYKVYVLYEYVTDNLEKHIQLHTQMKKHFTENKLWDLLVQSVSGLAYLQMKGIAHQNIKPTNIFFDQNHRVKIADSQVIQQMNMFSQVATNLKDIPKNSYLSPSLIDALRQNNWQPNHDANRSDVFSLGMAIMSAGLLQDLDSCYSYQPEPIFHEDIFKQKLNQFKSTFSNKITNFISMMTQINEDNRPDFTQLWIQLQQVSNQDTNTLNTHNSEGQQNVMNKDNHQKNSFVNDKTKQSPSHLQKDFNDDNENIIDDVDDQMDLMKRQNPSNYNKNYAEKQKSTQLTKNQIEQTNRNFTPSNHQVSVDSSKNSLINNTMSQLNPSTVQSGIIGKQTVSTYQDSPAQQNVNLKMHNQSPNFTTKIIVNPQNEYSQTSAPMNYDLQVTQSKLVNLPQQNYSCKTNPDEIQGHAIGSGAQTNSHQVQINNQQNKDVQSYVNQVQNNPVNIQSQNINNNQVNYVISNTNITPIANKNNISTSSISANLIKQNEGISGIQKQNPTQNYQNSFGQQQQQVGSKQNLNDISNINNYQNIDDFKISNQSNIFLNNNKSQQPPITSNYKPYSQNNYENKTKLDDFQNISVTSQANNNSFLDNQTNNQRSIINYKDDFNSNQSVSNNIPQNNNTSYQLPSVNKNFGNVSNNNYSNNLSYNNIQSYNVPSVNIPSSNMSQSNMTYNNNNISANNIQSNNISSYKPLNDYSITGITSTTQQSNVPYSQKNQDKGLLTNFEELQSKLREAELKAKQEYETQHGKPLPNTTAVHTFTINSTQPNTSSSPYSQPITKTNDNVDEILKKYSIHNQTNNTYGVTNNQFKSDIAAGNNNERRNSQYNQADTSGGITLTKQTFSFASQLPNEAELQKRNSNNVELQNKNNFEVKNTFEGQDKNPYIDYNNLSSTNQAKDLTKFQQVQNQSNNISLNNDQSYKLQAPQQQQQQVSQQYEQYNSQEAKQMQYPEQQFQNNNYRQQQFQNDDYRQQQSQNNEFNQQQFQNNDYNQMQFQNNHYDQPQFQNNNYNQSQQQFQNNNYNQQQFQQYDNYNNQQNSYNNNDNQYYSNDFGEAVIENYQNGSRYEGEKLNGVRHGLGRFYYQDGGLYDGEWKDNKMNGRGVLSYASGEVAYDGSWKDDQFHGFGALYNENPAELLDFFDYRDFDQVDEYWIKYDGEFKEDNKEGFGTLYLSNGERFEGSFKNDFVCGPGSFYKRNGQKIDGIWQNNKLIQS